MLCEGRLAVLLQCHFRLDIRDPCRVRPMPRTMLRGEEC